MGKVFKILLALSLILALGASHNEVKKNKRQSVNPSEVVDFLSGSTKILTYVYDLMHVMLRQPELGLSGAIFRSKEHEILGKLLTINQQVRNLELKVQETAGSTISTILNSFPHIVRLELRLNDLSNMIDQIDSAHDTLRSYLIHGYKNLTTEEIDLVKLDSLESEMDFSKRKSQTYQTYTTNDLTVPSVNIAKRNTDDKNWLIEAHTLQEFANWASGPSGDAIQTLLSRIHLMIVPQDNGILSRGILDLIKETSKVSIKLFNLRLSYRPLRLNLINDIELDVHSKEIKNLKEKYDINKSLKPIGRLSSAYFTSWVSMTNDTVFSHKRSMSLNREKYFKIYKNQYIKH